MRGSSSVPAIVSPRSHMRTSSSFVVAERRPVGRFQRLGIGAAAVCRPFGIAFVGIGDAKQRRLVEPSSHQLARVRSLRRASAGRSRREVRTAR